MLYKFTHRASTLRNGLTRHACDDWTDYIVRPQKMQRSLASIVFVVAHQIFRLRAICRRISECACVRSQKRENVRNVRALEIGRHAPPNYADGNFIIQQLACIRRIEPNWEIEIEPRSACSGTDNSLNQRWMKKALQIVCVCVCVKKQMCYTAGIMLYLPKDKVLTYRSVRYYIFVHILPTRSLLLVQLKLCSQLRHLA